MRDKIKEGQRHALVKMKAGVLDRYRNTEGNLCMRRCLQFIQALVAESTSDADMGWAKEIIA